MLKQAFFLLGFLFLAFQTQAQDEFITTWQLDNDGDDISIPTRGSGYDYTIDWGDGTIETNQTGAVTHAYATAGTYTVQISGDFPRIYFNNGGDKTQILTVEQWGEIEWTSMQYAFRGCSNLKINATDAPDLSACEETSYMFSGCTSLNSDLNHWDVSTVEYMIAMFSGATSFNQDISSWDVSNVYEMNSMFQNATSFNQDIDSWNPRRVYYMQKMFRNATAFNQPIGSWNVSRVEDAEGMFQGATSFNQPLNSWSFGPDEMASMFKDATSFNQPLDNWNIKIYDTDINSVFENATAFDQYIGSWNLTPTRSASNMLSGTALSIENYDNTLITWSNRSSYDYSINLGASGLTYCKAASARQTLIDEGWSFTGDTYDCSAYAFITTWEVSTDGESITIPTNSSYTYDYEVDWGDGASEAGLTGDATHTYTTAGTYTVEIYGTFPAIYFNENGDRTNIKSVEQWGEIEWESMESAFSGCSNLEINATDAPDLSACTSLQSMFEECDALNQDISHWDVSTITNMQAMFNGADIFNQPLDAWDVSNVENMFLMFFSATDFNQPLNSWNTSNVTNMALTFGGAKSFNQPLDNWEVAQLTEIFYLFTGAENFNQDISSWNTSNVTVMEGIFSEAKSFNQPLAGWDVSQVENMNSMFNGALAFNQDLSTWNVSKVETMSSMFRDATAFNQDIGSWDVAKVNDIRQLFNGASSFNQDISSWNVSNVANMSAMFKEANAFNQNLGDWDISNVTDINNMLDNTALSSDNYDSTLIGWSALTLQNGLTFSANNLSYCNAVVERQSIIDNFNWTITDAGQGCPFIITLFANNFTIPANSAYTYDYSVDWGDGTVETGLTGNATHAYGGVGTYTIEISGTFPAIRFNDSGNKSNIRTIEQWGDIAWEDMSEAFYGCKNLTYNATDAPNLTNVTSLQSTFRDASSFNGDLSNWDVSTITNMTNTFRGASNFNQNISSWDVSNVTTVEGIFSSAYDFNQDLSSWNTSNITNMNNAFAWAESFNQNLSAWDISEVTNMSNMLDSIPLSTDNYDQMLIAWSKQNLQSNVTIGKSFASYCLSQTERQKIIDDFGWTIFDRGIDDDCANNTTWDGSVWDNGVPTTSMLAIVEADYDTYIDGAIITDDLAVKSDYSLTVRGDSSVTMDGDLTNLGSILVQDTTSFIQTATSPSNSGEGLYSVEREGYDYKNMYNYWSSPVMNTTIDEVFGSNVINLYSFDAENHAWQAANTTTVLEAASGFIATGTSKTATTVIRTFADSTGFNSGDFSQTLHYSGTYDIDSNWHLVGNPYPSGLDVTEFLTDNASEIESAVYLWSSDGSDYNVSSSDYAVIGLAGPVRAGGSGIELSSGTISSAQGFFVQSLTAGTVNFSNSQRVSTNNTFQRVKNTFMERIWLGVEKDNGAKNEILLAFTEEAIVGKDLYDASKLSGNGIVSLYSLGNFNSKERKLAIQGLPLLTDAAIVPIGIEAKEAGEFVFSINQLDDMDELTEIYLYDSEMDKLVNLRTNNYPVSLGKGEYNDRFSLRFIEAKVTSLPEELVELDINIYATQSQIKIVFANQDMVSSQIGIYDVSGRLLTQVQNKNDLELAIPIQQTGIYIVRVATQQGIVSKKLLIH